MTEGQNKLLADAETWMEVGPVEMARQLNTPYSTYKKWRNESRPMPGIAVRCLELTLQLKGVPEWMKNTAEANHENA
jgi:hypothetical protein